MLCVTLSSFWINEINAGAFNWIRGLTLWTLFNMAAAIFAVHEGRFQLHTEFMIGAVAGAFVAGGFALIPERFIDRMLGY